MTIEVCPQHALEPFASYDSFENRRINMTRWVESEQIRTIRDGKLRLMQRNWGLTSTNFATTFYGFSENMTNPNAVTAIKARVRVNALEVGTCAANASSFSQSRARSIGSFFNMGDVFGPSTPGSLLNDVLGQVRVVRAVNSTDPAGVMLVQGFAAQCTTADCNAAGVLGSIVDLGKLELGQGATLELQWDKASKTFYFSRDRGAFAGSTTYTVADQGPSMSPFKQLSTRLDIAACKDRPRVTGMIDATFDKVSVNASAVP